MAARHLAVSHCEMARAVQRLVHADDWWPPAVPIASWLWASHFCAGQGTGCAGAQCMSVRRPIAWPGYSLVYWHAGLTVDRNLILCLGVHLACCINAFLISTSACVKTLMLVS